ncbi:hypothetical protein HQQ81_21585 [Microbacteriaceae bacterium VKM Ac-2854]|nr:hypothetical protein [Microbacteriaceae bacterium VKM Ac-2854]
MSAPLLGIEADAAALIAGTVRVDPAVTVIVLGGSDPAVAVPFIAARVPEVALLVREDVGRAHPYNIARRIASLHRLHGGRVGVLLSGPATDLGSGARAVLELWASWPESSLRLDKAGGVFADVAGIRRVNTEGVFRIDGPLTVPLDPADAPVLALDGDARGAAADLVLTGGELVGVDTRIVLLPATDAGARIAAGAFRAPAGHRSARSRLGLGPSRARVDEARATAYPARRA